MYKGKFRSLRVKFVIKATPTMIVQAAGNCSHDGATTQITSSLGRWATHYIIITSSLRTQDYIITIVIINSYLLNTGLTSLTGW
jgi:hypothetical protein